MTQNKNINKIVWGVIDNDITIQKNLQKEIINIRALARRIKEKHKINSSLHAIISSIRRFDLDKFNEHEEELTNIFHNSIIRSQNKVVCITIKRESLEFLDYIRKLDKKSLIKLIVGNINAKIIIASHDKEKLVDMIEKKHLIKYENVGEIVVNIGEEGKRTKGVMAKIANELSLRDINIKEMLASIPEIIIYIDEKDLSKASEILLSLAQ